MTPATYTAAAVLAADRYRTVLNTFRNLLLANQAQPFSALRAKALRSSALSVASLYLQVEHGVIHAELLRAAQETLRSSQTDAGVEVDVGLAPRLESYLEASEAFLESEIRAQLSRDVEALVKHYREFAVEADVVARATGMSMNNAIAHVGSTAPDRMRFQFRDRVGRLYPAQKFIRTVWRHTMIAMAAEFYMLDAAQRGATKFVVRHPDQDSKWAGYVIDPSEPNFLQVRDEIFHPNSEATLRAV